MLINTLYEYGPRYLRNGKALFKNIFEKTVKFRTKIENFLTLAALKMSWLATWFIFELIGVGAAPDLNEL